MSSVVLRARAFDRERRISHELQRNLLPDAIPDVDGWDISARYLPAATGVEVGGDWYDVVPVSDRRVALVVGDVEGHDLGMSRVMSKLRHSLGLLLAEQLPPGEALQRLNRLSLTQVGSRLSTALVGLLDTETGVITFSTAGRHAPVCARADAAVGLPVPPGPPLGVHPYPYTDHEARIDGGCLLMFTDGLVERRGVTLDAGLARLDSSLRTAPRTGSSAVADHVIGSMSVDERSSDDIVVLTACGLTTPPAPTRVSSQPRR